MYKYEMHCHTTEGSACGNISPYSSKQNGEEIILTPRKTEYDK